LLYSKGEEDGWVSVVNAPGGGWVRKKKVAVTAQCGAKAMPRGAPSGGTVMAGHDDDFDIWTLMNTVETGEPPSQIIQPGTVLATTTEAKAKEGRANHPADHAADGSDVSDEVSDAAAHGSSKPSSEAPDFIGWWEMEADSVAEDARLWTKEEKAQEAEVISKRLATFRNVSWNSQVGEEFWKREVERMRRWLEMLKQQLEEIGVKEKEELEKKLEAGLQRQVELEGSAIG